MQGEHIHSARDEENSNAGGQALGKSVMWSTLHVDYVKYVLRKSNQSNSHARPHKVLSTKANPHARHTRRFSRRSPCARVWGAQDFTFCGKSWAHKTSDMQDPCKAFAQGPRKDFARGFRTCAGLLCKIRARLLRKTPAQDFVKVLGAQGNCFQQGLLVYIYTHLVWGILLLLCGGGGGVEWRGLGLGSCCDRVPFAPGPIWAHGPGRLGLGPFWPGHTFLNTYICAFHTYMRF